MVARKRMVRPLRIPLGEAAARLCSGLDHVRDLIHSGVLTVIAPNGRGRGKRLYVLPDEVEAYALGGREAVERLRAAKAQGAA